MPCGKEAGVVQCLEKKKVLHFTDIVCQGLQPQECLVPAPVLWLAAWEIPVK